MRNLRAAGIVVVCISVVGGLHVLARSGAPPDLPHDLGRLIDTLDAERSAQASFPFDVAERERWGRGPARRPGLALRDMTPEQLEALHGLLRAVLSPEGYRIVTTIMTNQDVLGRSEGGLGRGYFWFALYGTPGTGAWAWRLGGHHVSLHLTYDGTEVRSVLPLFVGVNGAFLRGAGGGDPDVLSRREASARALLATLPALSRIADTTAESLVIGEQAEPAFDPAVGLSVADLDASQRAALRRLLADHTSVLTSSLSERELARLDAAAPDRIRIAWAGRLGAEHDLYFRIQSPTFLLEYRELGGHVHSLWRGSDDFGRQNTRGARPGPAARPAKAAMDAIGFR